MSFTPTPRKKIALDNKKLELTAPSTAADKTAVLVWGIYNNNPRIIVWTRDPADMTEKNGNGKIQAELDPIVMQALLETFITAIDMEPGWRIKLENKNFTFFGGKRSDEPAVKSEIWVGKDKEDFVYISVIAPTRPVIKFRIMPPGSFHTWYSQSGEKLPTNELNKFYVKAYAETIKQLYSQLAVTEYVDVQAEKNAKQGGNSGSWNKGQQSSYSDKPKAVRDEDLPF